MFYIGCHLSASKGYTQMARDAISIGANVFQFFTRNPRGGSAKPIDKKDIDQFLRIAKENNFGKILAHAPYTLNPAAEKESILQFAYDIMKDDLDRMEFTPGNMYNFHPGSHVGQGVEIGIEKIVNLLNSILKKEQTTTVLLETMSGKGSEIGKNFEELKEIIKRVKLSEKVGVCLDTCHVSDGGYDIVNNLDEVIEEFDSIIGLEKLKAIHINDSINPLGAHKDRHQKIGVGTIGIKAFQQIINHPKLKNLPFYLETPNELDGYAEEIKLLKSLYKD